MPQLWLTYQEIADHLGCEPSAARATAAGRAWTRKHSRDGQTRVLMPPDLMRSYFAAQAFGPPDQHDPSPPALEQLRRVWAQGAPPPHPV